MNTVAESWLWFLGY